jgi:nucleolar protein 6
MTPRNAGQSKNPAIAVKSKGCAFVEFKTSAAVQSALHLHQSTFVSSMSSAKRKINVELTAGGGGNSDTRKQKLSALKERLEKQREKHKTEADIAKEKKEEEQKAVRAEWAKNEAANAKAAKKTKKPPRFISGANSTKLG